MGKMIEKVKEWANYVLGLGVLVLSALLLSSRRKTQALEGEIATEKANAAVKETDHDREIAKQEADCLVASYDALKRDYDNNGAGGDTDL